MLDSYLTVLQLCPLVENVVATLNCLFLIFFKSSHKSRPFKHDVRLSVSISEL